MSALYRGSDLETQRAVAIKVLDSTQLADASRFRRESSILAGLSSHPAIVSYVACGLTQSGVVLGTVGYMSPEQAMGQPGIDVRSDIFSLGCVLFECLSGRPAFGGRNAVAVLAKVLRDEPNEIADLEPRTWALLARMLAKDPADRPADVPSLARRLSALDREPSVSPPTLTAPPVITTAELRIVSVLLGRPRDDAARIESVVRQGAPVGTLRELRQAFGIEAVPLRGGSLMIVLSGRGTASDHARQAADCALLLREARPDLTLAIATGRADLSARIPVGAAIDRAAERLVEENDASEGIAIDELTASLVKQHFEVHAGEAGLLLFGRRVDVEVARQVLGRPTPFVGREKELGLLELTLQECVADSVSRSVLITGQAGQGKSRLQREFVARVRRRPDVAVFVASAEAMGAGSAFTLARQLLRGALGAQLRDSSAPLNTRLRARISALDLDDYVADFLAQLLGVAAAEQRSPQLRAAHNDPQIMSTWLRRAFVTWLRAESARRPVLIVLDDLQWGDSPSIGYLQAALQDASAQGALMVLALARPEVHEAFPKLWAGSQTVALPLPGLSARAGDQLTRALLGDALPASDVARLVERAAGNVFYLEELILQIGTRGSDARLPETVLGLVEARIQRLDPEARRVLRAASIYGERFWVGGLVSLLGTRAHESELEYWLELLSDRELVSAQAESLFPDELEYTFTHALLREAAYATLSSSDAVRGHALAGDWLIGRGERRANVLADHFERSGMPQRAVSWLLMSAQEAMDGGNVFHALSSTERALAYGATGEERGRLLFTRAMALGMSGEWHASATAASDAMQLLPAEGAEWFASCALRLLAASSLSDSSIAASALLPVLELQTLAQLSGPTGYAIYFAVQAMTQMGDIQAARAIVARAEQSLSACTDPDPIFVAWLHISQSALSSLADDLGSALHHLDQALQLSESMGASTLGAIGGMQRVSLWCSIGLRERVIAEAAKLEAACEHGALHTIAVWLKFQRAWVLVVDGQPRDALAALAELRTVTNQFLAAQARGGYAQALIDCGRLAEAETEVYASLADEQFPWSRASSLRVRALFELRSGRPQVALEIAEQGMAAAALASHVLNKTTLTLIHAEALRALRRDDEACARIRDARGYLHAVADTLPDSDLRASFLERVKVHARTLELARSWLG